MSRASWQLEAKDLTDTPGEAAHYLTIGQLSDAINLSPGTIRDSITRAKITREDIPRSAICRPAARVGDVPLWSKAQCNAFLAIRARRENVTPEKLEAVTIVEARQRNLHSLVEYAEMFDVHDQTLRRAQSQDGTFPKAVARRRNFGPGVPEHLFELEPMFAWAQSKGYQVPSALTR